MKMTNEDYNRIVTVFEGNSDKVVAHYNYIKSSGKFKVLDIRVSWDCLRALVGSTFISEQYGKGLNDDHITTASVRALKVVLGE